MAKLDFFIDRLKGLRLSVWCRSNWGPPRNHIGEAWRVKFERGKLNKPEGSLEERSYKPRQVWNGEVITLRGVFKGEVKTLIEVFKGAVTTLRGVLREKLKPWEDFLRGQFTNLGSVYKPGEVYKPGGSSQTRGSSQTWAQFTNLGEVGQCEGGS